MITIIIIYIWNTTELSLSKIWFDLSITNLFTSIEFFFYCIYLIIYMPLASNVWNIANGLISSKQQQKVNLCIQFKLFCILEFCTKFWDKLGACVCVWLDRHSRSVGSGAFYFLFVFFKFKMIYMFLSTIRSFPIVCTLPYVLVS